MEELDTETLLAILSSLLDSPLPEQHVLLDALVRANGKVEEAARFLRRTLESSASRTNEHKRATGLLDNWLVAPSSKGQPFTRGGVNLTTETPAVGKSSMTLHRQHAVPPQVSEPLSESARQPVSFTDVLQPPPPSIPTVPQPAPLTLSNPSMVEKHTPCTLHLGVLPPDLACHLFHRMLHASKEWKANKWLLFDRVVESPHKTSFYARRMDGVNDDESWQEAAQFWYNGRATSPPPVFPLEMEEACQLVEKIVNASLQERPRYPLEWGGTGTEGHTWKANVAASNCYAGGKEGVGFHSDQLTYLGPFPTIASLSLGTTRIFRLREVIPRDEVEKRRAQTFNIPLVHNSLLIMHASTQECFKHSIPPQRAIDVFHPRFTSPLNPDVVESNCRINITFRFYRPDFRPPSIPRCRCNIPCVLRADMKGRSLNDVKMQNMRYFWMCYGGAQNDGEGCSLIKVMDCKSESRGPFLGD